MFYTICYVLAIDAAIQALLCCVEDRQLLTLELCRCQTDSQIQSQSSQSSTTKHRYTTAKRVSYTVVIHDIRRSPATEVC